MKNSIIFDKKWQKHKQTQNFKHQLPSTHTLIKEKKNLYAPRNFSVKRSNKA